MTAKKLIENLQNFNPDLEVQIEICNHRSRYRMPIQKVAKLKNKRVSKHSDQKTIITLS